MASVGRKVLVESRRVQMGKCVGGTDMQRAAIGGGSVSVIMVSRVCSVTMVALVACTPSEYWWLSSLLPVWGGVDPMWWHWVTWCGCPAVPGDATGVFPSLLYHACHW